MAMDEQKRCEVETCDNVLEDGEGTTIYFFSDWGEVVCDDCNEQYKNGEWTPDVEQERGR